MSEQAQEQHASENAETQEKPNVEVQVKPPEGRYTDRDVDKLKGQARKEARERAEREILERFGVESFDNLEATVKAQREREEAEASETEKERKAREKAEKVAQERQAELDEAYSRIAQMAEDSALRDALAEAEAKPARVKQLLRLAERDNLDVDDDGNLTGVKEEVERLKKEAAEFFGSDERPSGSHASPRPSGAPSQQADKEAAEAQRRRISAVL